MLFVWLFTLAAGIVNACVADPGFRAAAPAAQGQAAWALLADGAAAQAGTEGHAAPRSGDHEAPCLQSCRNDASTVPALTQASAPWSGPWLAPPPPPLVVAEPQRERGSGTHADALMVREGIPIVIAFRRLTR